MLLQWVNWLPSIYSLVIAQQNAESSAVVYHQDTSHNQTPASVHHNIIWQHSTTTTTTTIRFLEIDKLHSTDCVQCWCCRWPWELAAKVTPVSAVMVGVWCWRAMTVLWPLQSCCQQQQPQQEFNNQLLWCAVWADWARARTQLTHCQEMNTKDGDWQVREGNIIKMVTLGW